MGSGNVKKLQTTSTIPDKGTGYAWHSSKTTPTVLHTPRTIAAGRWWYTISTDNILLSATWLFGDVGTAANWLASAMSDVVSLSPQVEARVRTNWVRNVV